MQWEGYHHGQVADGLERGCIFIIRVDINRVQDLLEASSTLFTANTIILHAFVNAFISKVVHELDKLG